MTISPRQTKRVTFNANAELLAEAQAALGTGSTTETLNSALAEVVRRARLESLAGREFPDLTPEVLEEIRRGRTGRW
jgi:Arc/MetJ family transcription regulator